MLLVTFFLILILGPLPAEYHSYLLPPPAEAVPPLGDRDQLQLSQLYLAHIREMLRPGNDSLKLQAALLSNETFELSKAKSHLFSTEHFTRKYLAALTEKQNISAVDEIVGQAYNAGVSLPSTTFCIDYVVLPLRRL